MKWVNPTICLSQRNKKKEQKKKKRQYTLSAGNPLMDSGEPTESEFKGKHCKWCHFVISKPRESLVTEPSLKAPATMALEHCLHDDLPDFAYSTTIFDEEDDDFEVISTAKRMGKAIELGLREIVKYLKLMMLRIRIHSAINESKSWGFSSHLNKISLPKTKLTGARLLLYLPRFMGLSKRESVNYPNITYFTNSLS